MEIGHYHVERHEKFCGEAVCFYFIGIDRHGRNFVALVYPKRTVDMYLFSLVMKKEVRAFMRNREPLAIYMVKRINTDNDVTMSADQHAGQFTFEWRITNGSSESLCNLVHRHGRGFDTILAQEL